MDKKKWVLIITMTFLIMSSMYVGAFISKHRSLKGKPVYIHKYRGSDHTIEKLYPQKRKIRIWPFVDIEYNVHD
jgi:hypothetical protein